MADKRITDVDFIDLLNSNESFFVNQNNTIKQINKSDIVCGVVNGGTGVTTVTADSYLVGNGTNAMIEKTPDEVWSHIGSAGKTVSTGTNAEIFNDYTNNQATGNYSHAEGNNTIASGESSHAEGYNTQATFEYAHAEGYNTTAVGGASHAEGYDTVAANSASHAEGIDTTARGNASHAEGFGTIAKMDFQHVQGKYNIEDTNNKYAHIVGNGTSDSTRSNAHTLDWNGNAWFAGDIYIGGAGQDDTTAKRITAPRKDVIWQNGIIGPTNSTNSANSFVATTDNGDNTFSVTFDSTTYTRSDSSTTGLAWATQLNPDGLYDLSDYSHFIIECAIVASSDDEISFNEDGLMAYHRTSVYCPVTTEEKMYFTSADSSLVWTSGREYYHRVMKLDLENSILWCRYSFKGTIYYPDSDYPEQDRFLVPIRVFGIR